MSNGVWLGTYVSSARLTVKFLGMTACYLGQLHCCACFDQAKCLNATENLCLSKNVAISMSGNY